MQARLAKHGLILAGLGALALTGPWAATQMVAQVFASQEALGPALFQIGDLALYPPTAVFAWRDQWQAHYPRPFAVAGLILMGGALVTGFAAWFYLSSVLKKPSFGINAWGMRRDAVKAGLFAKSGAVLGKLDGDILCFNGEGHHLLIGPSRTGKGRSHVVPTLLTWPHAALVVDLKGELAQGDPRHDFPGTAGFRAKLGPTLCFAPTRKDSLRWNPLLEVRRGDHEVGDVQNLVDCLIGPEPKGASDPFWDKSAATILTGVILHVLYTEISERKTLAVVREKLATLKTYAEEMRTTLHRRNPVTGAPEVHPEILQAAEKFLGDEERMQSAIRATAHSYLGIFADPIVAANTAASDFRLFDLVAGDAPMTLYLQPPPHDLGRFLPLLRFFIEMTGKTLMADQTRTLQGQNKRHPLLFMLDEFPLLGRLRFLETNMGAMAGYGLKAYMVCQSPNHIRQTYGRDNVLIDNCQVIAAFGTAEPESAAWISSLAGKVYDKTEQVSKRRSLKAFDDGVTVTSRDEERALISAKDIQTLADTDQLIFVQGHKPLRAQKLAYDREPVFQNRLCPFTVNKAGLTTAHDWEGVRALGRCPPPPRAKRQGKAPSPDQDPLPFGQETESEVASAAPASTQPEPQPGPASATDVAATPELAEADVGEAKIRPRRRRPKLGGEG